MSFFIKIMVSKDENNDIQSGKKFKSTLKNVNENKKHEIKSNGNLDSFFGVKKEVKKQETKETTLEKILPNLNEDPFNSLQDFASYLHTWQIPLKSYIDSQDFKKTFEFVKNRYSEKICYPPKELIFNAFRQTSWDDIRVVIIGQDPYFNEGEAMGLCFSVPSGVKVPGSLHNIYKAMIDEGIIKTKPSHGNISSWASQGVLMLNATLTVDKGVANSHQKDSKWESFTDFVIKTIDQQKKNVVFLLWGGFAKKKKKLLKNSIIIENMHPSPLAVAATKGDFGAIKQFTLCNKHLKENGKEEINWAIN